jgi:prepilin-type N-terminal cleavage/methylation domain-containing protein
MKNKQRGFTIVELLIVIVVIGILAALVLNAYSDIQRKARNAQTISAVNAYRKGYIAYATDKGDYPVNSNYCLGDGYPSDLCWDNRSYKPNVTANAALKEYMGQSLPDPSTKRVYRNSTDGARAGILYVNDFSLRYQLEGDANESCGISGATQLAYTSGQSEGPECRLNLPNPATL